MQWVHSDIRDTSAIIDETISELVKHLIASGSCPLIFTSACNRYIDKSILLLQKPQNIYKTVEKQIQS